MRQVEDNLLVVGGGAAGLMAALTAARAGANVVLLEPQRVCGRKLRITGKGRCNLTNNCDVREFMRNVPRNPRFLYSALSAFGSADTIAFFENLGVPLKTERGARVFPVSDNANDIAGALTDAVNRAGVRIVHTPARGLIIEDGAVRGVETPEGALPCKAAIVCTGGLSYPLTGSTGDGYRFAAEAGHTVTPLRPSLAPLESPDADCARMQGFALKNVTLTLLDGGGKPVFRELGEMLFTHFGVSGPLALSASAYMRDGGGYSLSIDLKPGLDEAKLDARILRDFSKYKNRAFRNSLDDLAGRSMIPVLVERSGIAPDTSVNSITREQRRDLVRLFKDFKIAVSGLRPIDEAIVTSGGIAVDEINPRTMESKIVSGLYFAGEILDLDAFTGGFNLQIAWSTGRSAGLAAAKSTAASKGEG